MGNIWSSTDPGDEDKIWTSDAWYAMESGAFCIVCGAPFDIKGDVYNLDPKKLEYQVSCFIGTPFKSNMEVLVAVQCAVPWSLRGSKCAQTHKRYI